MSKDQQARWWQETELLTGVSLAVLVFVTISPLMVSTDAMAFGVPLGYFLAVIVVPLATAAAIFFISGRQERLDRRHHTSGA